MGKQVIGWSQSGQLTPRANGQAVTLQREFPEAGNYTVQFNVSGPDESGAPGARQTQATIVWSVAGNSVSRTIDIVNGTSISGTAEAVSVRAVDRTTSNGLDPYVVSIQVVKGTRASNQQQPYLSTPLVTLAAGFSQAAVAVPQDSGAISALVNVTPVLVGTPISTFDVEVIQQAGAATLKKYNPILDTGWIPLASGTTAIRLSQAAGAPDTDWFVTFGIDG